MNELLVDHFYRCPKSLSNIRPSSTIFDVQRLFFLILLIYQVNLGLPSETRAASAEKKSILFGHNVTPTTEVPKKGVATFGNYAAGLSLSDEFIVATSPWIWGSYNTPNLHLKWAQEKEDQGYGIFLSYFHSNIRLQPSYYEWQSASLHGLYSVTSVSGNKYYFNLHYAYFWVDDMPYSLRMDPGDDNIRAQVDLSTMAKIPIEGGDYAWLIELGALGVNYLQPFAHMGLSLAYQNDSWLFQVGASYTVKFSEWGKNGWTINRYDHRWHIDQTTGVSKPSRYLQDAIHPEIQIQYFF